jgi:spore maturation protein CgeB
MDGHMSLRRRFFRFRRNVSYDALHAFHSSRTEAEILCGLKPLSAPKPRVEKARSVRKTLLVCASEESGFGYPQAIYGPALADVSESGLFDFPMLMRRHGRKEMNRMLLRQIERESPDLAFLMLFTDEISHETLRHISIDTPTITFNCFADDEWRFDTYSRYWAGDLNFCSTTCPRAYRAYRALGYKNAMFAHWPAEPRAYPRQAGGMLYGATFVGTAYPGRVSLMDRLRRSGTEISCFGPGWPGGTLESGRMAEVFGRSRININFSRSIVGNVLQEKGRNYEVCAAGGFLLTEYFPGIEDCFEVGKEVAVFRNEEELAAQIRHYLAHEDERKAISEAGRLRVLRDHTSSQHIGRVLEFVLGNSG